MNVHLGDNSAVSISPCDIDIPYIDNSKIPERSNFQRKNEAFNDYNVKRTAFLHDSIKSLELVSRSSCLPKSWPVQNLLKIRWKNSVDSSLSEFRSCLALYDQLIENAKLLITSSEHLCNSENYNSKRLMHLCEQLDELHLILSVPEFILNMKKKLCERKKKRQRKKLSKWRMTEKCLTNEINELKGKIIDVHILKNTKRLETQKMELQVRNQANRTMSEIKTKLTDITAFKSLLEHLCRLRMVRARSAACNSIPVNPVKTENFENSMSMISKLCLDIINQYNKEKELLGEMIRSEEEIRLECLENYYRLALFNQSNTFTFPKSFDEFLTIRRCWDFYCVPVESEVSLSSCVPHQWATPVQPHDENWSNYIIKDRL